MAWLDVSHPLVGMELEELLSGGGTAQTAQNAQLAIKDVGNIGAPVLACGLGIELENIREEPRGKLIINVLRWSHEIFSSLTEYESSLKCAWRGLFRLRHGILKSGYLEPCGLIKGDCRRRIKHGSGNFSA
jgi:hypothetical protein